MKRRIIAVTLSATALWATTFCCRPRPPRSPVRTPGPATGWPGRCWPTVTAGDRWRQGRPAAPEPERDQVVTVRTRDRLAAAVAGDTPEDRYVKGHIDANTDSAGRKLSCADYARDGYTLAGYLAAYDPAVWGRDEEPSGPLEDARRAPGRPVRRDQRADRFQHDDHRLAGRPDRRGRTCGSTAPRT